MPLLSHNRPIPASFYSLLMMDDLCLEKRERLQTKDIKRILQKPISSCPGRLLQFQGANSYGFVWFSGTKTKFE